MCLSVPFLFSIIIPKSKEGHRSALFGLIDFWLAAASSELQAQRQLRLTRVAHADTEEAVEVEERGSAQRIYVVLVVEGIEQFDRRYESVAFSELKGPRSAPIERYIFIVLVGRIAFAA